MFSMNQNLGKFVIFTGLILILVGLVILAAGKLGFFRLPGDL